MSDRCSPSGFDLRGKVRRVATRDVFSADELAQLRGFPEIGRAELIRFFMLTPADEEFVRRFRDKRNVLGAAVQLCTLPWLGFVPDDVPSAPAAAVARLSERLGIPVGELRGYGAREQTRSDHLRDVAAYLGWRQVDGPRWKDLEEFLFARAMEHDSPKLLFRLACEYLSSSRLVRPGVVLVLERVAAARKRARKETWQRLEPALTGFLRAELDGMLVPGPLLGRTRLAWLGTGPVSSTPAAVKGELEKLAYLRGMDAHTLDLSVLPAERRRFLAGLGRRLTAQNLARRDDDRKYPILVTLAAQSAVDELHAALSDLEAQVTRGGGKGDVRLGPDGELIIPPLTAEDVPAEASALRDELAAMLPRVPIASVLVEIDARTGFTERLTHAGGMASRPPDLRRNLLYVIIAEAVNMGLSAMSESCGVPYDTLAWTAEWYFSAETLEAANAAIVNYHHRLPMTRAFGTGTLSSSDGQKFPVKGKSLTARHLSRYFARGQGVSTYTHVSDQHSTFDTKVITSTSPENPYVLDGILGNQTDLIVTEHATDTHGATLMWTSQDDLRWSEGGLGRVDVCGYGVGFGFVQPQVAGVGREPGPDRAGGDFVGGGVAGQFGWVGLADQERVSVVVLLGDQVAGDEGAGGEVADERQVPHVASPPDRGRGLGQREDGPQRPGQPLGVAVEPLVQRGEAIEVIDRLAQSVDVQGRGPVSGVWWSVI